MDDIQRQREKKLRTVNNLFTETVSVYSVLPSTVPIVTALRDIVDVQLPPFISKEDQSNLARPGKSKEAVEVELVESTYLVVLGLRSLADDSDPAPAWAEQVNFTRTQLKAVPDRTTLQRCELVHDTALANKAALVNYLVTNDDIEKVDGLLDAYAPLIGQARNVKSVGTGARNEIDRLLDKGDALLDSFIRKAGPLKIKNKEWWARFEAAITLVDPGSGGSGENGGQ